MHCTSMFFAENKALARAVSCAFRAIYRITIAQYMTDETDETLVQTILLANHGAQDC